MIETQTREENAAKPGRAGAVFITVFAFIFAWLLVFPGFMAGLVSKKGDVYLQNEMLWEFGQVSRWEYGNGFSGDVMKVILYPAGKLMDYSKTAGHFYIWQYQLVGGRERTAFYD